MMRNLIAPLIVVALGLIADRACVAADTTPLSAHDRIVAEYLDGKWDALQAELSGIPKASPASQSADAHDVESIRRALAECRPAWWNQAKAGRKFTFRPSVWGRSQAATFDPAAKTSIQLNSINGFSTVTVMWDASQMDDPAEAEHGFSKGELTDLAIWMTLGSADAIANLPLSSLQNRDEKARLLQQRYIDFRGSVTGAYYGTPRARRWALWLDLASYSGEHARMPTALARRAVAITFIEEVAGQRDRFPSVHLPDGATTEAAVAGPLKSWIEKHALTFAEDDAIRASLKTLSTANGAKLRTTGRVVLPGGSVVNLDPEADAPESAKRDAWLAAHLH